MSGARYTVFPSTMTHLIMKQRLAAVKNGHNLLKKKAEALKKRYNDQAKRIRETKLNMGRIMKSSFLSLAEVQFVIRDISFLAQEHVDTASLKVTSRTENISGVQIPVFSSYEDGHDAFELTGLNKGGEQVRKCKEMYSYAIELLVELATLQTSFLILDDVIKSTNRKVNAIEYILQPKIENTISYIVSELEELDREERFRMKKVVAKKREKLERDDEEFRQSEAEKVSKLLSVMKIGVDQEIDLLHGEKDPDVIF